MRARTLLTPFHLPLVLALGAPAVASAAPAAAEARQHCLTRDDGDEPLCFLERTREGWAELEARESDRTALETHELLTDLAFEFDFVSDADYAADLAEHRPTTFAYDARRGAVVDAFDFAALDCDSWWDDWGRCVAGTAGGAVTGALAGSAAGTVVPGIGTVGGAIVGAIGGGLGGAGNACNADIRVHALDGSIHVTSAAIDDDSRDPEPGGLINCN